MKIFSKTLLFALVVFSFFPVARVALAQPEGGPGGNEGGPSQNVNVPIKLDNPFSVGNDLFELADALVNKVVLPIGGVLCVLGFIYAGFLYVTARGNPSKISTAHNALLYSAIGTAILLGAWVIASVIRNTIGALTS
jgi:hypothetical protein